MNMGDYLPLLPPEKLPPQTASATKDSGKAEKSEPEHIIIKIYWGCDENVRRGQPRIIDTSRMGKGSTPAFMGSMGSVQSIGSAGKGALRAGWVEALWPNKENSKKVPSSASLVGDHFLHGNFLPHMRFTMGKEHDIMEKLSLSAGKSSLKEAIPVTWKKVPTSIGYHLSAFSYSDSRKEMVIWTSSDNPDVNVGSQFLDTPVVKKHIASRVILPADRDRCVIPKGIFDGAEAATVNGTAWGEDYWASEPPRPANPPQNWKPDWVIKGQFLSTGLIMLGSSGGSVGAKDGANILRGFIGR
jgi:hypothetical protein